MECKAIIAESERLILRRFQKEDLQDLFEYLSDKEVVKYEPYKPLTLAETKENLEWRIGTEEMIAVELKNSHKMIGNVFMGKRDFESLEIGYVFNRKYWGKGYAAESCRTLIRQAFSNGVHRIYAECDPIMRTHGDCWRRWDFSGKLILGKTYISGKMKPGK